MASTVNPFSIGVASGEAGVSIGDGIVLRVVLWVLLTAIAVAFVLRYAAKVRRDPSASIVGHVEVADDEEEASPVEPGTKLSRTQTWVLVITGLTFALMIFSVIPPWSSIFGATAGPAEDELVHATATEPYWFELAGGSRSSRCCSCSPRCSSAWSLAWESRRSSRSSGAARPT